MRASWQYRPFGWPPWGQCRRSLLRGSSGRQCRARCVLRGPRRQGRPRCSIHLPWLVWLVADALIGRCGLIVHGRVVGALRPTWQGRASGRRWRRWTPLTVRCARMCTVHSVGPVAVVLWDGLRTRNPTDLVQLEGSDPLSDRAGGGCLLRHDETSARGGVQGIGSKRRRQQGIRSIGRMRRNGYATG